MQQSPTGGGRHVRCCGASHGLRSQHPHGLTSRNCGPSACQLAEILATVSGRVPLCLCLDAAVPGEAMPAAAALKSVLLDVFNEHDYNKDGKVGVNIL